MGSLRRSEFIYLQSPFALRWFWRLSPSALSPPPLSVILRVFHEVLERVHLSLRDLLHPALLLDHVEQLEHPVEVARRQVFQGRVQGLVLRKGGGDHVVSIRPERRTFIFCDKNYLWRFCCQTSGNFSSGPVSQTPSQATRCGGNTSCSQTQIYRKK